MMEIKADMIGKKGKLFTPDAKPNPAFYNTFQTDDFRCILKCIYLSDQVDHIILKEGECVVSFQIQLMNLTNEPLFVYVEDFMLQCDRKEDIYPLYESNDEQIVIEPNDSYEGKIGFIGKSQSKFITLKYQEYMEDFEGKVYKLKYAIP